MRNTLSEMWHKYNLLSNFKTEMNSLGWVGRDLYVIDVQLNLLRELIEIESINKLNELLQNKTYYRLLRCISRGIEYLPDIIENNESYVLNPIEKDPEAWISKDVLIFTCKSGSAVFSKTSRLNQGSHYIDGKYQ